MNKLSWYSNIFYLKKDTWIRYFKTSLFIEILGVVLLYFLNKNSYILLQLMQIIILFAAYDTLKSNSNSVANEMIITECILSVFLLLLFFLDGFGFIYLITYAILFVIIPLYIYISFKLIAE